MPTQNFDVDLSPKKVGSDRNHCEDVLGRAVEPSVIFLRKGGATA